MDINLTTCQGVCQSGHQVYTSISNENLFNQMEKLFMVKILKSHLNNITQAKRTTSRGGEYNGQ